VEHSSEEKFQGKLDLPVVDAGVGDFAEVGVEGTAVPVGIENHLSGWHEKFAVGETEFGVIEEIKNFGAELQAGAIIETEIFE
jgi:hypothetical protein